MQLTVFHSAIAGESFGRRNIRFSTRLLLVLAFGAALASNPLAYGFTESQAHSGQRTFRLQCSRCHGVNGKGKDNQYKGLRAPKLIGAGALPCRPRRYQKLRQRDFRTAKDVYNFISAAMPADQPSILDASDYWNVLSYLLQQNGKKADDNALDASSSAQIVLNPNCTANPAKQPKAHP